MKKSLSRILLILLFSYHNISFAENYKIWSHYSMLNISFKSGSGGEYFDKNGEGMGLGYDKIIMQNHRWMLSLNVSGTVYNVRKKSHHIGYSRLPVPGGRFLLNDDTIYTTLSPSIISAGFTIEHFLGRQLSVGLGLKLSQLRIKAIINDADNMHMNIATFEHSSLSPALEFIATYKFRNNIGIGLTFGGLILREADKEIPANILNKDTVAPFINFIPKLSLASSVYLNLNLSYIF